MACALTLSYTYRGCKGGLSGTDEVYLIECDNITSFTETANVITTITKVASKVFRKYVLDHEMAMDSSDMTYNAASGPVSCLHKIDFTIKGQTTAVQEELMLLIKNNLYAVVKRANGTYWLYGRTRGLDVMGITAGTSKENTGFTGHNISIQGMEPDPAIEVDSAIITGLFS